LFVLKVGEESTTVSTAFSGESEEISKQTAINLGRIMQLREPVNLRNARMCFETNLSQILP